MNTDVLLESASAEMTEAEIFQVIQDLLTAGYIYAVVGDDTEPVRWHLSAAGRAAIGAGA